MLEYTYIYEYMIMIYVISRDGTFFNNKLITNQ